jgi:hypothetical protein
MKTHGVVASLALPILLALVACSGNPGATSQSASATTAKSVTPTQAPTQTPQTLTFELQAGKRYPSAHGTVMIDIRGYGYTLTVSVSGLVPGSQAGLSHQLSHNQVRNPSIIARADGPSKPPRLCGRSRGLHPFGLLGAHRLERLGLPRLCRPPSASNCSLCGRAVGPTRGPQADCLGLSLRRGPALHRAACIPYGGRRECARAAPRPR